jgi:N-methylhydantoinase A
MNTPLLGIDTGGTFTDFVLIEDGGVRLHKELSTPLAPEEAILRGMATLGVHDRAVKIVHGSTVATNAVLERKGVRTVFITNHGLRDVLTIGRQARAELYNLTPEPRDPPVPREDCLETGGRLGADGTVIEPLSEAGLRELVADVTARAPAAVAVTLLFSFLDPRFERAIREALPLALFVSCSSDVLPEQREYERAVATWLNAYVGPLMQGYLARLAARARSAQLQVMQSSGLACDADYAGRYAVNLLLSGPAGGLAGARYLGAQVGCGRLLTFDMGGTSTDVALSDGGLKLTSEGRIGPYPVGVAMVDLHTIGAGGGSIARVDAGGLLHVGPESAGADPGPACYGRGGVAPTVTDAHLVLGRIPRGARLGGQLALDYDAAVGALTRLGAQLGGIDAQAAAAGVIALANERMQQALRVISVGRGVDPRAFTLVSFGGAGGLHVCELAATLGIRDALVPAHAGVLSAMGMLAAAPGRQSSRTVRRPLDRVSDREVADLFEALERTSADEFSALGAAPAVAARSVDICYRGQSFTLNLPWSTRAAVAEAFHTAHAQRYGHALDMPLDLVNVRLRMEAPAPAFSLPLHPCTASAGPDGYAAVHGNATRIPIWERSRLAPGEPQPGPLILVDPHSTTYVPVGWSLELDAWGNCWLRVSG